MNTQEKREMVSKILSEQNRKMFTVEFIGVKGDTHKFNGRLGVYKYSNGGINPALGKPHLITGYNVQKHGYRNINLDGITRISASHQVYTF